MSVLMERREDPWAAVAAALEEDPPGDRRGEERVVSRALLSLLLLGLPHTQYFTSCSNSDNALS